MLETNLGAMFTRRFLSGPKYSIRSISVLFGINVGVSTQFRDIHLEHCFLAGFPLTVSTCTTRAIPNPANLPIPLRPRIRLFLTGDFSTLLFPRLGYPTFKNRFWQSPNVIPFPSSFMVNSALSDNSVGKFDLNPV